MYHPNQDTCVHRYTFSLTKTILKAILMIQTKNTYITISQKHGVKCHCCHLIYKMKLAIKIFTGESLLCPCPDMCYMRSVLIFYRG